MTSSQYADDSSDDEAIIQRMAGRTHASTMGGALVDYSPSSNSSSSAPTSTWYSSIHNKRSKTSVAASPSSSSSSPPSKSDNEDVLPGAATAPARGRKGWKFLKVGSKLEIYRKNVDDDDCGGGRYCPCTVLRMEKKKPPSRWLQVQYDDDGSLRWYDMNYTQLFRWPNNNNNDDEQDDDEQEEDSLEDHEDDNNDEVVTSTAVHGESEQYSTISSNQQSSAWKHGHDDLIVRNDRDILMGSFAYNTHPGNSAYRNVVRMFQSKLDTAYSNTCRNEVSQMVYDHIHNNIGGRFLKKRSNHNSHDRWHIVPQKDAIIKISKALVELRKPPSRTTTTTTCTAAVGVAPATHANSVPVYHNYTTTKNLRPKRPRRKTPKAKSSSSASSSSIEVYRGRPTETLDIASMNGGSSSTNQSDDDGLDALVDAVGPCFTSRFGEVCWAQGGAGFGWWPAFIYDPRHTTGDARQLGRKHIGRRHLVYFFECHDAPFSVLSSAKITEWEAGLINDFHLGKVSSGAGPKRTKMFRQALQAATVEIAKPIGMRLDWNHWKQPQILQGENCWPNGWTKIRVKRTSGSSVGHMDSYWFTPKIQYKLRSLVEVKRFIIALQHFNGDEMLAKRNMNKTRLFIQNGTSTTATNNNNNNDNVPLYSHRYQKGNTRRSRRTIQKRKLLQPQVADDDQNNQSNENIARSTHYDSVFVGRKVKRIRIVVDGTRMQVLPLPLLLSPNKSTYDDRKHVMNVNGTESLLPSLELDLSQQNRDYCIAKAVVPTDSTEILQTTNKNQIDNNDDDTDDDDDVLIIGLSAAAPIEIDDDDLIDDDDQDGKLQPSFYTLDGSDDDDDDDDIQITGSKGMNALSDLPHPRHECVVKPFTMNPEEFCPKCFCYVCDIKASACTDWHIHCNADNTWLRQRRRIRNKRNAPERARRMLAEFLPDGPHGRQI